MTGPGWSSKEFGSVEEAASYVVDLLGQFIGANTLFVAANDRKTNRILKAFNREQELVSEGTELPLPESYCGAVLAEGRQSLAIRNTADHPLTCGLDVTRKLGARAFAGVPIVLRDGTTYGTVCVMDTEPRDFEEKDIRLLSAMASLLAYMIELENAVVVDSLSGLYNRNFVNQFLQTWNKNRQYAVLYIDLDGFKAVNDSYGHEAGDRLLKLTAERFKSCVRGTDVVARIGGDEFLCVLADYDSEEHVRQVADRILQKLGEPYGTESGRSALITCSIGISLYPEDGGSLEEIIRKADLAMYEAKARGKNSYAVFGR
ncbi:sensor domain-containing diguanylate cyclase [Paenibacillus flagellatus]|uniref:GGDEF domain-containing protein n=1 Tax=Paenibacillus flagellatus TaxID=2211139 RepID=A0A2V5KAH0_9BACL|nr:sensor domain-containing diguanylate cyclase [Paenibacillus flagellatus]PYI56579.1 hypothetical protein DLM86_06320 [Paenibacillus flagellatus]